MTKYQRNLMQTFLGKLRELCADHAVVIRVRPEGPEGLNAFISIAGSEDLEFLGASDESAGAWHEDDEKPMVIQAK